MTVFLDRIDSVPVVNSGLDSQFIQWLSVLVDSLNETLGDIEALFNVFYPPPYTQTQILQMQADGALQNGVLLHDTTNDEYVGRKNGVLVKFTTGSYP